MANVDFPCRLNPEGLACRGNQRLLWLTSGGWWVRELPAIRRDFSKEISQKRFLKRDFSKEISQKRFLKRDFSKEISQKRFLRRDFPEKISQKRFPRRECST